LRDGRRLLASHCHTEEAPLREGIAIRKAID